MYSSIPEKYLPDSIIDNVGYFADGRYQFVLHAQRQIFDSGPTEENVSNYPIIQATGTETLSGVRTIRNLAVYIDPEVVVADTSYMYFAAELVVRRQGVESILNGSILDGAYDIERYDSGEVRHIGAYKLFYPDVLHLNSGDTVVLVVHTTTSPQMGHQIRFPIRTTFFIKFN